MTAKLAKIVLSIIVGMFGLVLVMGMLACSGPAAALEEDVGESGGGALIAGPPSTVLVDASPEEIRADGQSNSTITGRVRDSTCMTVAGAFLAFTTSLGTIDQICYAEAEGASVNKSSGDWITESYAGASGGQYVRSCGTSHPKAALSWTFTATAISMLYVEDPEGGLVEVQVDGNTAITVDMYAATRMAAERVITAGLGSGSHVVTVRYLTQSPVGLGTCIRIDAFRCGATTDANGQGTATLTSTILSCGSEDATVTAFTGDPSVPYMITNTKSVKMTASVPTSVTVTANSDQIAADGTSTSVLEAVVEDQFSQYVPDCTMVSFFATDENGAAGEAWATLAHDLVEGEATEVITSGSWTTGTHLSHHGTEVISSTAANDTAVWTFTGTAVSLIYPKLSDAGVATVTVDSGSPITIDMYASSPRYQVEHVITDTLSFGPHVITVTVGGYTVTGGTDKCVYVDAFRSGTCTSGGTATAELIAGTQAGVVWVEATGVGRQCCETDSVVTDTVPITLTAGDPYTLTITPTDLLITCCNTSTLQFTVTDQYCNVVGAVVPTTLTVDFTSTPYVVFTPTNAAVVVTEGVGSLEVHGWTSGTGTITGTVREFSDATDTSNLTVTASSCHALTVNASPPQIYVTDENTGLLTDFPYTSTTTARVTDRCENPVEDGMVVNFTTNLGSVSPITQTTVNGWVTTTLTSQQISGPTQTATIVVTPTGCSGVTGTTTVVFGRHVHTLTVAAAPKEIVVGGNTSTLTADVKDGFGDPTPNGVMVGFTITPAIASLPYEFVEGEDPTEVITDGWAISTTASHHGGQAIYTNTANAAASWTFTGTAVSLMFCKASDSGVATVTVGSTVVMTIDMYSLSPQYQVEKVITNTLSDGPHTITVTVAGYTVTGGTDTRVYVDAFRSGTTTSGGMATAIATSGSEAGVATIEAAAIGSTITNTAPITITAGNPYTLTIAPENVSITCCVTSTLHFTVTDQYSNVIGEVSPRPVTVCLYCQPDDLVDSWSPGSCVSVADGVGSAEFHGYGAGTGTLKGYCQGSPDVKDALSLTVMAGSPASLAVTREPDTILADGLDSTTITATVKDSCENPVCNSIVTFEADSGTFAPPAATLSITRATNCNGVAVATLTSGCIPGTTNITVTLGSLTATTYVDMVGVAWDMQLVANPTSIQVGGYTSNLTATVSDQFGYPVLDGTEVTFTTSLGSVGSDTTTRTTTDGVATAVLTSSGTAGTATITATVGSGADTVTDMVTVTFEGGPPYTVTLEANPTSIFVGGYTSTLTVTVTDQYTNPVANNTVVTFTTSSGSLGSETITKTTTSGVATAVLTSPNTAGTAFITAAVGSRVGTTTVEFKPDSPYTLTLAAQPMTLTVGETSSLTATVMDQYTNLVGPTVVTFTTNHGTLGSGTLTETTETTADGIATATLTSQVPGTATIIATADTVSDTVDVAFEAGSPYTVTLEANPMSILVGGFTSALTVTAVDQFSNNVADGTSVLFETSLGSLGSVTVTQLTVSGVATATLTSGETAGTAMITATAGSEVATTVVTFTPDVPCTVTLVADPANLTVGETSTLTATVKDQYDNNVADETSVLFETNLGSLGSLTVTKTTAGGVAVAALTSQEPGTATVVATAGTVSDTAGVTFEAGAPYTVTLEADPASILVGGFTSVLTVTAVDQYDNNVADGTSVLFETSLGSVGSVTVTQLTVSGVATATLTSGETAGTAMITATAGSEVATTVVTFTPDVPCTVTLVADPANLTVGETSTLTATVKDQYDNNVADETSVLFETNLGSLGSLTVTKTTAGGVAVAALTSQEPGTATVIATADTVSDTVDVAFEAGPPYTVTLEANPTSILVGGFTSALTVTAVDQFSNNVADGTSVLFETSLGSLGSVTVTQLTVSGVATATLTSGETAGTAMITATAGSEVATTVVTFTPDVPYTITLVADPTSIPIGGFTSDVAATVRDQYDNLVANGTAVTLTTDLGSIGSNSVVKTTVNGVANATLTSELIIGTANVTATSGSAVGQTQVIFTVGAPETVTVESWPPTIEVGGDTATITATATDIGGYLVADDTPVVFTTDFASIGSDTVTKYTTDGVAVATLTSGTTPGVAHVTATSNSKSDTATVKVASGPPFDVQVTADPTDIPIGGATSRITATVKDQYGNNVTNGTNVDFFTTLGSVLPSSSSTDDGTAVTTLTSGIIMGTATVTAISDSEEGSVEVNFTRGSPFYINVVANPTNIALNGHTSNIQATVKDIGGNYVADGTEVTFVTSLGILDSDTESTVGGVAEVVLTSGTVAGTAVITATADSHYHTAGVVFSPDPLHAVTVTADPMAIPANGASTSAVRATVTDQYGNMVADGIGCSFHTSLGTVWPLFDTTFNGVAETTLTSSETTGLAAVTAICGGIPDTIYVSFYVPAFKLYLPTIFKAY